MLTCFENPEYVIPFQDKNEWLDHGSTPTSSEGEGGGNADQLFLSALPRSASWHRWRHAGVAVSDVECWVGGDAGPWSASRELVEDAPSSLQQEFYQLVKQWRRETGHLSSIERKAIHPAYQRIIAMGKSAVPLVLQEMAERGGHWFWALHYMTGIDLSEEGDTVEQLRDRWLRWGRERGFLGADAG